MIGEEISYILMKMDIRNINVISAKTVFAYRELEMILKENLKGRREQDIPYIRLWKSLPNSCVLNLEEKSGRQSPKRIISISGGLGLLQMVLESVFRRASKDARPPRGVDCEILR